MAPKVADKLTDAEKKKVKQANKAKANPLKAEEKAKTNLKRRIGRGQIVDPLLSTDKKKTDVTDDVECHTIIKPKKITDGEKTERRRIKMLAIEKDLANKQSLAEKERLQSMINGACTEDSTEESTED